ncbi:hypothetical protein K450DRAFT_143191 [Umbelopsis ramanniana AG]|uniref:Uncharacterized protein n=1 Tax=Umbelopsis ramanniana AG TaxID=1314678 RepID=A0AAD5HAT6_UMBRA|nr:uncharacterized protein K450DRAFT_143191 [Umbelopsis ramanniana AG]KAI8575493.1 hypothetical protein K450DRAFT_143191 [Umbelopsis ramanniana AG]
MHIFKRHVENDLGESIPPFELLEPPSPLTTVRYTEQDYRNLLNQVEGSSIVPTSDGLQNTAAKNGKNGIVDIASWIHGRASISDLQLFNLFTGQPIPTPNSYVDPCTMPFVNFTQLSEHSVHHSYGPVTNTDKPLTPKNPDGLNFASRHAATSVMVTDDAVPDDHYDVTSSSTDHSLVTSTNNPSPIAPRITLDIANLASTPPNSVIHNTYGDHTIEPVEEMEDVIGEILEEAPRFVAPVRHKPNHESVAFSAIDNEYNMQTTETPSGPDDEKATTQVLDKLKNLRDIVRSISEDGEDDVSDIATHMDVDKLPEPVNSSEPTNDNGKQKTLHTAMNSDEANVQEPENSTVHIEQDKADKTACKSVLVDHHKLQVATKVPADTAMSADASNTQEPATNDPYNSQQPMVSEERIPKGKQLDSATASEINVEHRTLESTQLVENAIRQQTSLHTHPTKSIDIVTSDNHPVMVDDDLINERLSSVEYTPENTTESTTECTKWLYRSTDIEVLEPITINPMEKEKGHIYPKQICLDPQHIYVVRPNAWRLWEDQSEPSNSDMQAINERIPVRKTQNAITDEEYSLRLKLLKTDYKTKQASIDEEEREAMEKIQLEIDNKRDAMMEAYEREIQLLQSAWEARSDHIG